MLLMADSRSIDVDEYHRLALTINAYYAKKHNYTIRYVHTPCVGPVSNSSKSTNEEETKECIACRHAQQGGRSSPWCKVLAVNETLHHIKQSKKKFDRLVYIDSDAFVNQIEEPLPNRYFKKTLTMFANNEDIVPCSGIQFWQTNTDRALGQIIPLWWDSNAEDGHYNTHHDYEQSAFHRHNESRLLVKHKGDIGVILESVREYNRIIEKGFFRHITKKTHGLRYKRMQQFIRQHNISIDLSQVETTTLVQ